MLVLLAGFFAASEAALVSISRLRARTMTERRVRGARNVELLVDEKTRFLTAILVGNTIVLLAADSLATYIAILLQNSLGRDPFHGGHDCGLSAFWGDHSENGGHRR